MNENLMVMESDRTSPMLRSIQSSQVLLNHYSFHRGNGTRNTLEAKTTTQPSPERDLAKKEDEDQEWIENCSDPKFVPFTRSSREVKLLYSEHQNASL